MRIKFKKILAIEIKIKVKEEINPTHIDKKEIISIFQYL